MSQKREDEKHLVSDDEEEEILSIKNKFRAVTKKIKKKPQVEDLGPDVALKSVSPFEEGNEDALGGLGSGEDTDYLDISDVGSYETNSDGDFISRSNDMVFFDDSTIVPRFELGMVFKTQQQLKDALYAYAMASRFDFKYVSNRKEKTRVVCKKKCVLLFYMHGFYKIKTLVTEQQCSITFQNKRANFKLVGKHFLPTIRSAYPYGTFELMVERPTIADRPNFKRLYGEILSVVGRDSNNQIFPIAWAVIEVENRDSWT
ncbi:hypothetical protein V6N12_051055 [Hibiscus sabdariffa]|uniref:Transposase MuDR plant domain-containing protein n=1 Tax=Hibiscus sabdariffa TaxID=183260 RepID=A0ABR2GE87_9ROSI